MGWGCQRSRSEFWSVCGLTALRGHLPWRTRAISWPRRRRVSGIIRPQDIDRGNTIRYDKMAEARISYGGRGSISRQQVRGYGEDVMDVILPY